MTVRVSVQVKIAANKVLSEETVERMVEEELPDEKIVRVEGGRYTYVVVREDGRMREVYPLGECELCGRDTLGSGQYCDRCLAIGIDREGEGYYTVDACIRLVGKVASTMSGVRLERFAEYFGISMRREKWQRLPR